MEFSPRCYPEEVLQAKSVLQKYQKRPEIDESSEDFANAQAEYFEAVLIEARRFWQK